MSIAGYSFLDLQEEVLEFQFSPVKYRPLVKKWLNQAQRVAVIQSEFRTQQELGTLTTTAEDGTAALPADYSRLIDFYDGETGRPLDSLDTKDFDQLTAASGRPTAYAVLGEELHFYPTPDAPYELSLRYWRLPQDMEADGDEPEIPAQYHDILIAYAMQKAYARENDYAASNFWKGEWEAGMAKMRGEVQSDSFSGPRQVPGMWDEGAQLNAWT